MAVQVSLLRTAFEAGRQEAEPEQVMTETLRNIWSLFADKFPEDRFEVIKNEKSITIKAGAAGPVLNRVCPKIEIAENGLSSFLIITSAPDQGVQASALCNDVARALGKFCAKHGR